jgi:BTB/POZ domain
MVRTASPALTESTESTTVVEMTARTETLWAELQQIQQTAMEALNRQRDELEQEKESMNTLAPDASDIVTINVGGQVVLQTTRDTVCLAVPGSRFAALFIGRWEDHCVKDTQGRIFLDHDPELVLLIVNYMRIKRVEDPVDVPVSPPTPPDEKRQEWDCLLKYYGLEAFFAKPFSPLDFSKLTIVQPQGWNVSTQRVGQGLQLTYNGVNLYRFVACTPCLIPATKSSWKVTINKLPNGGWIFMGLIGNAIANEGSFFDPTSFGWCRNSHVWVAGTKRTGESGWTCFTEGECLLFGLANYKLTMFSVTKSKRFVIDGVPDVAQFIHFNFNQNETILTLEPLDATEYATLVA